MGLAQIIEKFSEAYNFSQIIEEVIYFPPWTRNKVEETLKEDELGSSSRRRVTKFSQTFCRLKESG